MFMLTYVLIGIVVFFALFRNTVEVHSPLYLIGIAVTAALAIIAILHSNWKEDYPQDWKISRHIAMIIIIIVIAIAAAI